MSLQENKRISAAALSGSTQAHASLKHIALSRRWVHATAMLLVVPLFVALNQVNEPWLGTPQLLALVSAQANWWLAGPLMALLLSGLVTASIILSQRWHAHLSMDHDLAGVQKLHSTPVPRIGGVGVYLGLFAGLAITASQHSTVWYGLWVATLPVFAAGLVEDFTKRVSSRQRLVWAFATGLLACVLIDATVTSVGITWIDSVFNYAPWVAVAFTAFAVAGMANAINMIDGLNGLAAGVVSLTSAAIALFAWSVGDPMLVTLASVLSIGCLGFWVFNYPFAKIFLGDGGAYFLGAVLAIMAVLLQARHAEVFDAWLILSILAYPVVEAVFSIARRAKSKLSVDQPDNRHLHQLVQQRLLQYAVSIGASVPTCKYNSNSTPFLWALCGTSLGLSWLGQEIGLPWLGVALTAGIYSTIYALLAKRANK